MKVSQFMEKEFGKHPGDISKQLKIIDDLRMRLRVEEQELQDILMYEHAEKAVSFYRNAINEKRHHQNTEK